MQYLLVAKVPPDLVFTFEPLYLSMQHVLRSEIVEIAQITVAVCSVASSARVIFKLTKKAFFVLAWCSMDNLCVAKNQSCKIGYEDQTIAPMLMENSEVHNLSMCQTGKVRAELASECSTISRT